MLWKAVIFHHLAHDALAQRILCDVRTKLQNCFPMFCLSIGTQTSVVPETLKAHGAGQPTPPRNKALLRAC